MYINQIMSADPVCVGLDDHLSTVKEIFDSHHFHHLLVVEHGKLVGVLSDRDLLRSISPNIGTSRVTYFDMATLHKPVHHVMTRRPIALGPLASVMDAVEVFNKSRGNPLLFRWRMNSATT